MPIFTRLREYRERALLSQRDLAARADVAVGSIIRAEKGEPIRFQTARKIAAALGCEPDVLAGEQERRPG
jgi:transcriptional regulator with XRE-family HTH domain